VVVYSIEAMFDERYDPFLHLVYFCIDDLAEECSGYGLQDTGETACETSVHDEEVVHLERKIQILFVST
jgi:hypothetical protein